MLLFHLGIFVIKNFGLLYVLYDVSWDLSSNSTCHSVIFCLHHVVLNCSWSTFHCYIVYTAYSLPVAAALFTLLLCLHYVVLTCSCSTFHFHIIFKTYCLSAIAALFHCYIVFTTYCLPVAASLFTVILYSQRISYLQLRHFSLLLYIHCVALTCSCGTFAPCCILSS